MKICILTQTASDISDYYKFFFKGLDLFFVTFKEKNSKAIDFLPSSTWSDGRNRLWDEVKGKYDYYLFIDDDLDFYKAKFTKFPLLQYIYQQKIEKSIPRTFEKCSSDSFFRLLKKAVDSYKPEVLSVKNLSNLQNHFLDVLTVGKGSFVRRMGWFDAQFTLFSDYAANRLLPYDTTVSGWASAQILIYLVAHHVFGSKSISLNNLGVNNSFHSGAYVPDYKSNLDCKNMIAMICECANRDYRSLFDENSNHVNLFYGKDVIISHPIKGKGHEENYRANFSSSLTGLEKLMINNNLQF